MPATASQDCAALTWETTSSTCALREHRDLLDAAAARVLHRALTRPGTDRAPDALETPQEQAAAARLIAAGILDQKAGLLRPTPRTEATFGTRPNRRIGVAIPTLDTLLDADTS